MATKCSRPACTSGLPAQYEFEVSADSAEGWGPTIAYCGPCVAFCITQNYFTADEVDSLRKIRR